MLRHVLWRALNIYKHHTHRRAWSHIYKLTRFNDKSVMLRKNMIPSVLSLVMKEHIVSLDKDVRWRRWRRCQKMYDEASKIVWLNYFLSLAAEMFRDINFPFLFLSSGDFSSSTSSSSCSTTFVVSLFSYSSLACWRWRIIFHL